MVRDVTGLTLGVLSGEGSTGAIEEGFVAMNERDFDLEAGSGNIFRDLGDPHADLKHAKAVLAARIIAVLDDRRLSAGKAGQMTGFAAADFARIRDANLRRFTLDRLMKILAALDADVRMTLHIDPQPGGGPHGRAGGRTVRPGHGES